MFLLRIKTVPSVAKAQDYMNNSGGDLPDLLKRGTIGVGTCQILSLAENPRWS